MTRFRLENGKTINVNGELDLGAFTKAILNGDAEKYLISLKNNDSNFPADDDKIIDVICTSNDWFVAKEGEKPKNFIEFCVNSGKLDPSVLGDKYYQKLWQKYSMFNGKDYTQDDFQKDILMGQIFREFYENGELSADLIESKNNEIIDENNSTEVSENDKKVLVEPEVIVAYIKDKNAYIFPFDAKILDDINTMDELRKNLRGRSLEELKVMLSSLQEKNERLKAEIASLGKNNINQKDEQIEEQKVLLNENIVKTLKNNSEFSNTLKTLKTQFDPNDSSAMDELRKEHQEKQQKQLQLPDNTKENVKDNRR